MDRSHLASGQTPVAGHSRTNRDDSRVRGIAGGEFFPIAQDDLYRALGHFGQEIGDGQVARISLASEIAPYRDDIHADLRLPQPQRLCQLQTRPKWRFARTPGLDPALIVDG